MGNPCEYFRAPSADQAAAVADGGPIERFDTVDGREPDVVLDQLIAHVRGVEWRPGLSGTTLISAEENDFDAWVCLVADDVRDTLADIPDDDVPALARWWAAIEELAPLSGEPLDLAPDLRRLVALTRRARDAGEHLYVWMCL
ncbi:hypothetical protein [Nocardia sp. NRRL S-836]|uniref:hypothetical protein n=1 Tax=Nocardia sp. NRRL S-836 TaxID=1519492 RepID=UPI0006AEFD02|nr:hypothetical protein [Nocardia sp. NRRL S-836]